MKEDMTTKLKFGICNYCFKESDLWANYEAVESELREAKKEIKRLEDELNNEPFFATFETLPEPTEEIADLKTKLAVAEAQRDVFKSQCESMFKQLMER